MLIRSTLVLVVVAIQILSGRQLLGQNQTRPALHSKNDVECQMDVRYFEDEIWAKVGERTCIKCHNVNGDASESNFLLSAIDSSSDGTHRIMLENSMAFETIAKAIEGDRSRMLLKVSGGLEHGGGEVLKPDSHGYKILEHYLRRLNRDSTDPTSHEPTDSYTAPPFFEGVAMISQPRLLRRITLSLAARLPSDEEHAAVHQSGLSTLDAILDRIMKEDAFFVRLKEGFNDIFLTVGIEDNAETLLSYDHFEHSRLWTQKHDLDHLPKADQQKARWALADVYRDALLREPLELIAYIVQNDRPFSELATADYIMVSPYTARGYGMFEELKDQFKNIDDPFEYIPARLKALKSRDGRTQESATGFYPHAGFLSMFHYLRRYPSTETNRNRLRARMFYQHFLGIDLMQLAPRGTDASAVAAKYETPTMQAAECVVCHKVMDPVAGMFQDFNFEGNLGPRKQGWYNDMFQAGFEDENLPSTERWRAQQWLAERAIRHPRFPIAMVEHVYSILFGRKVLQPAEDIGSPMFGANRRAYLAQRRMIENVAKQFADSSFNLKTAFKALIISDFYRADGLATVAEHPQRRAELDDVGVVRLLGPEQLERKLQAVFGKPWGRLGKELKILYGGIDSITVTERNADPSGAMGAIQRIMANDVACNHVAKDFRLEPSQRLLFSKIEPSVLPTDDASVQQIRQAIVSLQQRILGQDRPLDHPEVEHAFQLFVGMLADAKAQVSFEPRENYFCGGREEFRVSDPDYTIRAWRGVVTYLLRQHEFLYE